MTRLWIVRAGVQGERELAAIDQNKLFPGFLEVGDLTKLDSRDAILADLQEVLPDEGKKRLLNFAAQLNQFVNQIKIGDYVVMPRKLTNGVAIGITKGNYQFDATSDSKHSRSVEWKEESLPRDTFKQDLRYSFGAFMTICEIRRNSALERVKGCPRNRPAILDLNLASRGKPRSRQPPRVWMTTEPWPRSRRPTLRTLPPSRSSRWSTANSQAMRLQTSWPRLCASKATRRR